MGVMDPSVDWDGEEVAELEEGEGGVLRREGSGSMNGGKGRGRERGKELMADPRGEGVKARGGANPGERVHRVEAEGLLTCRRESEVKDVGDATVSKACEATVEFMGRGGAVGGERVGEADARGT